MDIQGYFTDVICLPYFFKKFIFRYDPIFVVQPEHQQLIFHSFQIYAMKNTQENSPAAIKPCLGDIADALGVSKATVSRAISGKGRVSAKTREKVRACIKELNYRPDMIAKSLSENKTYNIGIVMIPITFMRHRQDGTGKNISIKTTVCGQHSALTVFMRTVRSL